MPKNNQNSLNKKTMPNNKKPLLSVETETMLNQKVGLIVGMVCAFLVGIIVVQFIIFNKTSSSGLSIPTSTTKNSSAAIIGSPPTFFERSSPKEMFTKSDLNLSSKYGAINPYINGSLDDWELVDASYYNIQGSNDGIFDIYTKTLSINNNKYLYLGIRISHDLILTGDAKWVDLFFDEGNDGYFGSGTKDGQLNINQEDRKGVFNASSGRSCQHFFGFVEGCPEQSCTPQTHNNCWECVKDATIYGSDWWSGHHCVHMDTHETVDALWSSKTELSDGLWDNRAYGTGWYSEGIGNSGAYGRINFMAYKKEYLGHLDAEFLIPFVGRDAYSPGIFDDESDVNFQYGDTLGLGIVVSGIDTVLGECTNNSQCAEGFLCEGFAVGLPCPPFDCSIYNSTCIDGYCSGKCTSHVSTLPSQLDRFNAQTYASLQILTPLPCEDGTLHGQCNSLTGNICINGHLYLIGDLDKNGYLNADDIDLLINYLFRGEPFPEGLPLEVGDTNSDGKVNISDIVYLINYLYKSGPAPCQTPSKGYQPAIPDKNYTLEKMENIVEQYQKSEL